jgi:hypothetical protein
MRKLTGILLVMFAISGMAQSNKNAPTAIPTFQCISLEWPQPAGSTAKVCAVEYRTAGASSYVAVNNTKLGTYQQLANQTANFWESCKATGKQVVPVWDAGWNPLPRILYPTPWHIYPDKEYYTNATANELALHFKNGLQWLKNNKEAAQAQCAIIYAWNEFDEGG